MAVKVWHTVDWHAVFAVEIRPVPDAETQDVKTQHAANAFDNYPGGIEWMDTDG